MSFPAKKRVDQDDDDAHSAASQETTIEKQVEEVEALARKEDRIVSVLRIAVVFLIFALACGVSAAVYISSSHQQEVLFEARFEAASDRVFEAYVG